MKPLVNQVVANPVSCWDFSPPPESEADSSPPSTSSINKFEDSPLADSVQVCPTPDPDLLGPPVEPVSVQPSDDDDDWGEWEIAGISPNATPLDNSDVPQEDVVSGLPDLLSSDKPAQTEEYVDHFGMYVPTEADFATRITTQYGRGLSTVWGEDEDPDTIDSDLENVPDLPDDQPVARDVIIGQVESVSRPVGKKAQSIGLWKLKVRHGIARIDGQEIFFDSMYADLEF